MKEYGNYYHREDIDFYPLKSGNYLGDAVLKASCENDINRKVYIVRDAVQTLFNEAFERNEAKLNIISQGKFKIFYVMFDYNGVMYYWWEKYETEIPFTSNLNTYNSNCDSIECLASKWRIYPNVSFNCTYTLEFKYRTNPVVTYVGFSSNFNQTPLMCIGDFKNFKL